VPPITAHLWLDNICCPITTDTIGKQFNTSTCGDSDNVSC